MFFLFICFRPVAAVHHLLIGSVKGIIPLYFCKSMRENPSIFSVSYPLMGFCQKYAVKEGEMTCHVSKYMSVSIEENTTCMCPFSQLDRCQL